MTINGAKGALCASAIALAVAVAGWAYAAGILSAEIRANTKESERKDIIIVPRSEIDAKLTDITNQVEAVKEQVVELKTEVSALRKQTAEQTTAIIQEISRRREFR